MKHLKLWLVAFALLMLVACKEKAPTRPTEPTLPPSLYNIEDFSIEDGEVQYSGSYIARKGIDVAEHQGEIDWQAVAESGIEFAFIRIGYRGYSVGDIFEDPFFAKNIQGARAAGLDVGVYFFSQAINEEEAVEEGEFVCLQLSMYEIDLPVIYDWEYIEEGRSAQVDFETVSRCTEAFLQTIARRGYDTGVYFNLDMAKHINMRPFQTQTLWLADYNDYPTYNHPFHIWQYTDQGTVPGIEKPTDLDIMFVEEQTAEEVES